MTWVQIEEQHLLRHEEELLSSISQHLQISELSDQISEIKSELRNQNSMLIFSMQVAIKRYLDKKNKGTKAYKDYQSELKAYKKRTEELIEQIEASPISTHLHAIEEEVKETDEKNQFDVMYYGLVTTLRRLIKLAHDPDAVKGRPNTYALDSFIREIALFYEESFNKKFTYDQHDNDLITDGALFAKSWFEYAQNVSQLLGCKEFYSESSFRTACKRAVSTLSASK